MTTTSSSANPAARPPCPPSDQEKKVLVVPEHLWRDLGGFRGFVTGDPEPWLHCLLETGRARFLPRALAEEDPTHHQLIPYLVLKYENLVFRYTRGGGSGEARLRARSSIGVGGHVEESDAPCEACHTAIMPRVAFERAIRRELAEEVTLEQPAAAPVCVGFLFDDSTPVGRVHLGIVYLVELATPQARAREDHLIDAQLVPLTQLQHEWATLETWSQLCARHLFGIEPVE